MISNAMTTVGAPWSVGPGGAAAVVGAALGVSGGTSAVSALTRLTMPYPYWSSRPGGPLSSAVAVRRWMTSTADSRGNFARTNAAAPAMIAVASLVPVPVRYPVLVGLWRLSVE